MTGRRPPRRAGARPARGSRRARSAGLLRLVLLAGPLAAVVVGAGARPVAAATAGNTGTGTTGTGNTGTGNTGTGGATSGSGGSGSGQSALGGYTLTATGAGISVYYEQPNFPLPATPTLEADLGYSQASFDAGPTGQGLASVFWPGSVVANGASQLNLLLYAYLQPYFGDNPPQLPNLGPWPFQASTAYPQGPDTQSNDNGTVTMDSTSTSISSTADSALGNFGGASSVPAGMVVAQSVGSTVQSTVDNAGAAVADATSSVHNVSIAGGLITVGQVTSTATATSDGNQATVNGSSTVAQVAVAGQAVTVTSSGVSTPAGSGSSVPVLGALGTLLPSASQILSLAGITMTLTNPTDTVNGASGERQLDGLQVVIDLTTLDKNLATLVAMLPAQLSSELDQLPLPVPNAQTITVDLGWVNVNSAASPPYDSAGGGTGDGSSSTPGAATPTGNTGALGTLGSTGSLGTPGTPGTAGSLGTPDGAGPTGGAGAGPGGSASSQPVLATTPVRLFKGIGAGLIVLGLLLAGLLAFVLLRADAAVGALAGAPACAGESPPDFAPEGSP